MTDNTWPTVDTELIDDVTLYSAKLIIPVTGPVIIDGAVAIHGDRVVHVGKRRWVLEALKQEMTSHGTIRERHWDGVLTPGLVNGAHSSAVQRHGAGRARHLRSVPRLGTGIQRGVRRGAEDPAMEAVGRGRCSPDGRIGNDGRRRHRHRFGRRRRAGFAGHARHRLLGGNGLAQREWMEKGRTELVRQLRRMNEEQLPNLGISPHAPYTLESEPFVDLPDIARQLNMRLHIHLAETRSSRHLSAGAHHLFGGRLE